MIKEKKEVLKENTEANFFEVFGRDHKEDKNIAKYCKKYWKDESEHILRIADEAVRKIFVFDLPWDMERTYEPVRFEKEIIWDYVPKDDLEFVYQMNRHRYFICLGQAYKMTNDEKYAKAFLNLITHWIKNNPITDDTKPLTWRSIEAGIRAEYWIKAMGYFEHSKSLTKEVLSMFFSSLKEHGEYLMECNGSFSEKSNWGVLENHGLYMIGMALLEESYTKTAIKRLCKELEIQIMEDGVHWEQSPMYHNEVLHCCLEVIRTANLCGDKLPEFFYNKVKKMAYVNLYWKKPDNTQIAAGDSDQTDLRDIISVSALVFKDQSLKYGGYERLDFEGAWDYGIKAIQDYEDIPIKKIRKKIFELKKSGNFYIRSGFTQTDNFFHFKCGSLGGGHGHFDKLHIDLTINGEDVLIDSGRYTYVPCDDRFRLKSAGMHNTVIVDEEEYTKCLDSWDVLGLTPFTNQGIVSKKPYTYMEGGHLGYINKGIYVNRKIIAIGTQMYIIADEFYGKGSHKYEQRFHFNPEGKIISDEAGFSFTGKKAVADFYPLNAKVIKEDTEISRYYNQKESAQRVRVYNEKEDGAFLITVIIGQAKGNEKSYTVTEEKVISAMSGKAFKASQAQAVRIQGKDIDYMAIISHTETGSDCEYLESCNVRGMGNVLICDKRKNELVVLKR